jgi:hypothetical protein
MRSRVAPEFFVDPGWRKPAHHPNHAEMSRAAFVGLVAGWCGYVSVLLFISVFVRLLGWGD